MWSTIALVWVVVAAGELEVKPLNGPAVTGTLVEWNAQQIRLRTADGERTWETGQLQAVKPVDRGPPAAAQGDITIELLDGSLLRAETYLVRGGKSAGTLRGGRPYEFRTRAARAVRFRGPHPALDEAWTAHRAARAAGDLLVIRKAGQGTDQVTLDVQPGMLHDVTAETVQFELDDERIPVKRERLEGLLYFSPTDRELPDPLCRVEEVGGSVWNVKSLRLDGQQLALETVGGIPVSIPLERLVAADFSAGNAVFLSDLDTESAEWRPFIESRAELLARFHQPRKDAVAGGGKLLTGGQVFEKGLAVHSRTELVYRVPRGFRRFEARVGIDDRVRELGDARLIVSGDGKQLCDVAVTGRESPQDVSLDVSGVKRLVVLVDFGGNGDAADAVILGNARLTK